MYYVNEAGENDGDVNRSGHKAHAALSNTIYEILPLFADILKQGR